MKDRISEIFLESSAREIGLDTFLRPPRKVAMKDGISEKLLNRRLRRA
jgi:hypothetical protein